MLSCLSACATLPSPTPGQAARAAERWPGVTLAVLEAGRDRYVAKCSSCHSPRVPGRYPEDTWSGYLDRMGGRAKLTDEDRDLILKYVLAVRVPG